MANANFRVKNGLYVVENSSSSGNLTLLDGVVKSDGDLTVFPDATSGTNTAGNDMIVQGGAGTGSGAGGAIKFNVAGAGGSGSSANAQATKMQIASTGIVTMTDGTNASNTTSGTLIVTGGVGISQNLYANVARFTGSTASSSTTSGALIVTGGAGIGGDLYVGDDLRLASDSALLTFGANDDVLLTHVADVGLQLSTTATSGANPVFEIYQDNSDANGGVLRFKKEAGSSNTADNDKLGVIQFFGDDDNGDSTNMGTIEGRIQDASNNDELGRLMLRPRADSGGNGGVIIDGLTVEGLLNKKHHISVAVGGNRSGDATGMVTSSAGSTVTLFQAPADNSDKGAQHFAANGSGSVNEYTVIPAVNIGGGGAPRTFSATATASGSAANYTTNLFVNGTGYTEARISSVLAQKESYLHPGLGSALVLETVDNQNFNGVYFSRDTSNALSWIDQDMSSDLATEGTWGAGWLTNGTDFSIGFHAAKYDSCAIQEAGTTQLNPLVSGKSLLRISTVGNMAIGTSTSSSSGLKVLASSQTYSATTNRSQSIELSTCGGIGPLGVYVNNGGGYASGSASAITVDDNSGGSPTLTGITSGKKLYDSSGNLVGTVTGSSGTTINFSGNISHALADNEQLYGMLGGVVYVEPSQSSPSVTAGRLYNKNGALHWNGTDLTAAGASALGSLSDVTYSSGDLSIASLDTFTMSASDTVMKIIDTSASGAASGGILTLGSDDGAVMANDHRLGVIDFVGAEDTSNTQSVGARIQAVCRDAWDGSNNDADLEFYTVNGTTVSKVLTLDADKLASFEGDVTISGNDLNFGNGATVVNTDANTLTITEATTIFSGDIRVNGNEVKDSGGNSAITFDGSGGVTILGDLTVSGDTVQQDVATVTVEDPLMQLARSNSADSLDIGFYAKYVASGTKYTGLFRDASDSDTYKLFATTGNSHAEPTTTVNTTSGFTLADLDVGTLDATTLSINTSGTQDAIITSGSQAIAAITDGNSGTIDSFAVTSYPATKYLILVEDEDSNEFMSTEILALGHSTDFAELTQYALLYSDTELGTFSVANSSGTISLTYAANTAGTDSSGHKVRVVATRIATIA